MTEPAAVSGETDTAIILAAWRAYLATDEASVSARFDCFRAGYLAATKEAERLRLKNEQYAKQLDDRWAGVVAQVNQSLERNSALEAETERLRAEVERLTTSLTAEHSRYVLANAGWAEMNRQYEAQGRRVAALGDALREVHQRADVPSWSDDRRRAHEAGVPCDICALVADQTGGQQRGNS